MIINHMYDLQLLINKIYLYENDFFHYYSIVAVLLLIQLCYFYIYHNGRTKVNEFVFFRCGGATNNVFFI